MWKWRLFYRLVCLITFVMDLMILTLTPFFCIIGVIRNVMIEGVSFKEWWDACFMVSVKRLKKLFTNLWQSFRDGELYEWDEVGL